MTHPALIALSQGTITADEFFQRAPFLEFPVTSPTGKALAARLLGKHEATVGALMARTVAVEGHHARLPASVSAVIPTHGAKYVRLVRRQQILTYLTHHPWSSRGDIAAFVGISENAVFDIIARMVDGGEVKAISGTANRKLFALPGADLPRLKPTDPRPEYDRAVLAHIRRYEGESTTSIGQALRTSSMRLKGALQRLCDEGQIQGFKLRTGGTGWVALDRPSSLR